MTQILLPWKALLRTLLGDKIPMMSVELKCHTKGRRHFRTLGRYPPLATRLL